MAQFSPRKNRLSIDWKIHFCCRLPLLQTRPDVRRSLLIEYLAITRPAKEDVPTSPLCNYACNLPRNTACTHRHYSHRKDRKKSIEKKKDIHNRLFYLCVLSTAWGTKLLASRNFETNKNRQNKKKKKIASLFFYCERDILPSWVTWLAYMRGQWFTIDELMIKKRHVRNRCPRIRRRVSRIRQVNSSKVI